VKTVKIAIASDHGGFQLKEVLKSSLTAWGIAYKDFGCDSEKSVDYPDYAKLVAEAVAQADYERGVLVCGTGIGMAIAANKIKGIRSSVVHDTFSAHATREHNDTNIITFGARVIGSGLATDILKIWLNTEFEGGRHLQRLEKISALESSG
jgi:ribose 5-phosphate isomerase B